MGGEEKGLRKPERGNGRKRIIISKRGDEGGEKRGRTKKGEKKEEPAITLPGWWKRNVTGG